MKLKDHPKFPPKLCWRQDGERKRGQYDPINFPPDMRQAMIVDVELSRDRAGVAIHAKHPDATGMTGTTIIPVGDEKLAGNLLQTAQKFVEKTFGDLVEADVTNEMLLTS